MADSDTKGYKLDMKLIRTGSVETAIGGKVALCIEYTQTPDFFS